jgi:hypothetical protein
VNFIDWLHLAMALLFGMTALERYKRQGESFFIRLVLAAWFLFTTIFHDLPVETIRNGSAIGITIMLLLEYTAPFMIRHWERKA